MRRFFLILLVLCLIPHFLYGTVQLQYALMTKPAPNSSCQVTSASPPQAYTTFSVTDPAAYLWFYVTGAAAGDVFASEYYTPAGQFYSAASGAWDPLPSAGNWCFTDVPLQILGATPASLTGIWTVKGKYNGATLFTLTFTISSGSTTTGLNLTINQAITSSCPNNKIIVSVTNSQGQAITGLTASNFTLKEAGALRTITVTPVTSSTSGALSMAILIDVSGSLSSSDLANEKAAAKQLISQKGSSDAIAVYSFTDTVKLLQDFTTSASALNTAVDSASGGGNTALYQSVQTASQALAARSGRKAIVLMTDGEDTVGGVTIDQAIAAAKTAGAPIFTVGFGSGINTTVLTRLATETGGFFSQSATSADLQKILQSIGQVISSQYEISYTSALVTTDNTVDITVTYSGQTAAASRVVSKCSGGTTTGLTMTVTQVIDSACPNDKVIVSVVNNGQAVTGLTASNFTLKESGTGRSITVTPVGNSSSSALSMAILIDVSGSLSSADLANEKAAAKQLISQKSSSDAVAVYSFTDAVKLLQDFTTDTTKLNTAVDSASGGGNTALYQSIQAASQALGARSGRKAIVLMTDGEDTVGGVTIDQAIAAAKTAGAPIFTVGFGSGINTTVLTRLATETGGTFSQTATSADLQKILQSIGQVISSQYEIDYTSGFTTTDNTIEITCTYGGQTVTTTRTVNKCSSGSTSCTYLLQPQSLSVPAAGGSGTIIVITQAGCALNPSGTQSWIKIVGYNSGAVSWTVDPNTGAARSGYINIGNRQVPVTQDGAATCSYSITPAGNVVQPLGATSSFRIVTSDGCPWTAKANDTWLHITSATSGTRSANIIYTADLNATSSQRTGTIGVAGLTYTVGQGAGASPTNPTIAQGGIVNAASNRPGIVARGSFFTIYGSNLGPQGWLQVDKYPIPDTMGGVVVMVTQGSYNKRAFLHFVSAVQINGILPSDAPLGDVQMTVNYNGNVSSSSTITVVDTSFGTFSAAGGPGPGIVQNYVSATQYPLNMPSSPAKPNQIVVLSGTGLGPIAQSDANPPPVGDLAVTVEVYVGGKRASKMYSGRAPNFAGVDNIYFTVPADAPLGCSVPVQIKAGQYTSNTVRMAISADGSKCQDTANPYANTTVTGGKSATIGLIRVGFKGQLDSSKPAADTTFDAGIGIFAKVAAGGDLAFSPFMNLPPVGSCASNSKSLDLGSALGSGGVSLDPTAQGTLDAGTELTVTGPAGTGKIQHFDPNSSDGPYVGLLGGTMPIDGPKQLPAFLEAGTYTISGPGGKDVGAFSTSLTLPAALTWTNQSQINTIVRSQDLTVTWSGGDPSSTVLIAGGGTNQKTKASGGFLCLVQASAGTFTVPANVLADIPVTGATVSMSESVAALALVSLPMSNPPKFTAPGIDSGVVFLATISAKTVAVQ